MNESNSVNDLLIQYRNTLKEVRNLKKEIQKEIDLLEHLYCDKHKEETERRNAKKKIETLVLDKKVVNSWESNLLFSIEWMATGRRPGNRRGAERRAAYERETPFEPYWIQRRKDSKEKIEIFSEEDEHSKEQKENLVKMMTSCLTSRQKEMLELLGNGYSYDEIAKLLKVHKGTVSRTIARAKEKIENEGWFMP